MSSHVQFSEGFTFFSACSLDVTVSRQQGPLSVGNWPSRIESVARDTGHQPENSNSPLKELSAANTATLLRKTSAVGFRLGKWKGLSSCPSGILCNQGIQGGRRQNGLQVINVCTLSVQSLRLEYQFFPPAELSCRPVDNLRMSLKVLNSVRL